VGVMLPEEVTVAAVVIFSFLVLTQGCLEFGFAVITSLRSIALGLRAPGSVAH